MDDDETVDHYAVKTDEFLVLVKQTPGKPKPPVYRFTFYNQLFTIIFCSQKRSLIKDLIIIWGLFFL